MAELVIKRKIKEDRQFIIYGAGIVAYGIYVAIRDMCGIKPTFFLITENEGAKKEIDGIPIIEWKSAENILDKKYLIIVATPELYHEEIGRFLTQKGFFNLIYIDSHTEYLIMREYLSKEKNLLLIEQLPKNYEEDIYDLKSRIRVYMAISHKDKTLKRKYYAPEWIVPVQAGSVCTDVRLTKILDCYGDNISAKNQNYCELTVTYWSWKNQKKDYMGICHYRRSLQLCADDVIRCIENNVDIIMPLPYVCYPNISGQYLRYISPKDINILTKVLENKDPELIEIWNAFNSQNLLYNYNMLIAKKDVYCEYCEWLFSILKEIEEYADPYGNRADRYIGYIGEVLTSLYIYINRNRLKIVHCEKKWML